MSQEFSVQVTTNTTVVTTAETIVATTPAISTPSPDTPVTISGVLSMTYGTGTTAVTVQVRRGTTVSGTLVGEANAWNVTAGNTSEQTFSVKDTPGDVAGQSYVITVTQTGATANGTVQFTEATVAVG
jgi:hypothetical protein